MKNVRFAKAESLIECDWFASRGAIDAMVFFNTPLRFMVLHKVLDYKQRSGYHMCVDICPEYISFSRCFNQLGDAMKEVTK